MKNLIIVILLTSTIWSANAQKNEYIYKAKIISVYDGDTVTALVDLGFNVLTVQKLRLSEIDTPEVRGSERPEGLKVRDTVRAMILEKEILIQTFKDKKGKFGRYIVRIYIDIDGDGELDNLNQWLIDNKLAKPYK